MKRVAGLSGSALKRAARLAQVCAAALMLGSCGSGGSDNGGSSIERLNANAATAVAKTIWSANVGVVYFDAGGLLQSAAGAKVGSCPAVGFSGDVESGSAQLTLDWTDNCLAARGVRVQGRLLYDLSRSGEDLLAVVIYDDLSVNGDSLVGTQSVRISGDTAAYTAKMLAIVEGQSFSVQSNIGGTFSAGSKQLGDEIFTLGGSGVVSAKGLESADYSIDSEFPLEFTGGCAPHPAAGRLTVAGSAHSTLLDYATDSCRTASVSVDGSPPVILSLE